MGHVAAAGLPTTADLPHGGEQDFVDGPAETQLTASRVKGLLNAERVDLLELVWSAALRLYDRDAALAWLFGINPRLGDRRPIDLVRAGRTEELMRAIRAERADSFA